MTFSEENYLKIIYHLGPERLEEVTTNAIADAMQTKASSVTDMIKKLHEKGWVEHKKYQGVSLTEEGEKNALCHPKAPPLGGISRGKAPFLLGRSP